MLHGGPGSTAQAFPDMPGFQRLEQHYTMVYWDQRGAGISQGNPRKETLERLDQYVEDLDKVIALINARYANPTIFLMGHSWGGLLGPAYLLDSQRQKKVKGWIEINGAHNLREGKQLSRQWVIDYAQKAVAEGERVAFWQYALEWYDKNPVITDENLNQHSGYVGEAHGYTYHQQSDSSAIDYQKFIFQSPMSIAYFFNDFKQPIKILDIDYTPQLKSITLPVLVIWGRHDGILPVALAYQGFEAYGSRLEQKRLLILENSAHNTILEEPFTFANGVIRFVDKFK
jgi:pimeloyl-ACP methyl ester carboxylesterase